MTWAKFGVEFFDECNHAHLSDAAFRTHVEGIAWLYGLESKDMKIRKHTIPRFASSEQWETAVKELLSVGFWKESGDTYVVVHHAKVVRSSLGAQQSKRHRDRESQKEKRAREKAERTGEVSALTSALTSRRHRQTDR